MWRLPLAAIAGLLFCQAPEAVRGDDAATLAELIDRHVQARLDSEGLARVPPADDAEFLRRVFLDLHGVVPSAERAAKFLSSGDPQKRVRLIEDLLASPRFGEHFGDMWRRCLISPLANEQRMQSDRFADWLAKRFNDNDGWDRIAFDLLTATGKIDENAAVTHLVEGRYPLSVTDLTDLSSRYFLGDRLNCAQSHDQPIVEWKRQDNWGMAAFFAQIQTPGRPKVVYLAGVQDDPKMTLSSLRDADAIEGLQIQPPTFLGGQPLKTDGDKTHRVALAEWITSRENPFFARAMVNRMWWHFFGRGIVNPVDDMHAGNPASHPEMLDQLSRRFAESGFDLKLLCRAIASSNTYHQTSRPGKESDSEAKLFARMSIKVLSAEQLYDSLVEILGPPAKAPGIDTRLGARSEFCQFFAGDGDPDPTRYERGIPHMLRLMNSPQFAGRNVSALISRAEGNGRTADDVVEQLFLTILARRPTSAELELVRTQLRDSDALPQTVHRELAWALLMSSEFSLNH
ncbi:MAG: DUF1549 and DUF1553 domain-containing protein [Planctomycetaceae bacterium]|nr:DUF1549 and DUF1553 domain-containing protein [Planctomycetaceae bacterium]